MRNVFEDPFSEEIWKVTYKYYKDETLSDTFRRVAKAVASVEKTEEDRKKWEELFYDMLSDFKVTAGGRIYTNAGTEWKGSTLLNCFVSPNPSNQPDSLEGIYEVLLDQAKTLKSEGGWGHNFSAIRPRGSFISKIGVESPGAVKFMELFDKSSEIVTSGAGDKKASNKSKGKIRKGAMMGILDIWHPDVIEFITSKQIPGRLTKFNISVNCTNEFMNKLLKVQKLKEENASKEEIEKEDRWDLVFPDTTFEKFDEEWDGDIEKWKEKNYPVIVHKTVSCTWLWDLIMTSTYNRAEPGVLFLDRANEYFGSNYLEKIRSTNPCGEQCLPPGGSCNLGSLNLTQMVKEDENGNVEVDFEKIKLYAKRLVRFLDNVNDLTELPLEEYEKFVRQRRRIGCGIIGWGSLLYMLQIPFGSEEANKLRDKIMQTYTLACFEASIDLAIEKGAFIGCDPEKHANTKFIKNLGLSEEYMNKLKIYGIRNSSVMSCQPTGNTSIFANVVSGGIEPVFMPEYIRTVIVTEIPEDMKEFVPKFWEGEFKETKIFKWDKEGDETILKGMWKGTVYKIDKNRGLTKEVPCMDYGVRWLKKRNKWNPNADYAISALKLPTSVHVNDLKGFARWVDSSISKTVNVPYDYPFENFKDVYIDAYKSGYVKGITTYRTGTMTAVLSEKNKKNDDLPKEEDMEEIIPDVKLPNDSPAHLKILKAEGKKWYLFTVMHPQTEKPMALFVHTNAHEKNVTTFDALEKLFNLAREKNIPEKHIKDVEKKISGDNNPTKLARTIGLLLRHGVSCVSIVNALDSVEAPVGTFVFQIKKFLSSYIKNGEKVKGEKCDSCGQETIIYSEGCKKCQSCGTSKC